MAGIYFHIPFCRKACHYCDFHFSTQIGTREKMLKAIAQELTQRADYLSDKKINTIYFGGGTPSLLTRDELMPLFDLIYSKFEVSPTAEVTLEANPDDLDSPKIHSLVDSPVNRLSIGIQSFREQDLILMNRSHSVRQAEFSVKASQDAGFSNITIDLIYGIPGLTEDDWKKNLVQFSELNVPHFSAYCLTIEEKTAFASFLKKGIIRPVGDDITSSQFAFMIQFTSDLGYQQYEVSNFARPGFESRHNSAYWSGEHYLGIGPSAHSFNGNSRQWNVPNNNRYIKALAEKSKYFEIEILSEKDRINELVMTGLRTIKGIDLVQLKSKYGVDLLSEYNSKIDQLCYEKKMIIDSNKMRLTPLGMLFADKIASDFFVLSDKSSDQT